MMSKPKSKKRSTFIRLIQLILPYKGLILFSLIMLGAYFRSSLLGELSGMIEVLERDVSVFFGWEIVDL